MLESNSNLMYLDLSCKNNDFFFLKTPENLIFGKIRTGNDIREQGGNVLLSSIPLCTHLKEINLSRKWLFYGRLHNDYSCMQQIPSYLVMYVIKWKRGLEKVEKFATARVSYLCDDRIVFFISRSKWIKKILSLRFFFLHPFIRIQ
jgi:hypothetical protein